MSEEPISAVKRAEPQVSQASQLYYAYQEHLNQAKAKAEEAKMKGEAHNNTQQQTQQESNLFENEISKLAPGLGKTTALRFEVNSETNEMFIKVIDKNTQKVITTIPPDAIKDIPVGDLLKYSI